MIEIEILVLKKQFRYLASRLLSKAAFLYIFFEVNAIMLTEQKEKAITALLKGEVKTDIAKSVGVSRTTIYEWLKDPEFSGELEQRRQDIVKSGNDFVLAKTSSYLEQLDDLALHSSDARTKASVLMYLVDRALGKTPSHFELEPVEKKKIPSREDLRKEIESYKKDAIIQGEGIDITEDNMQGNSGNEL